MLQPEITVKPEFVVVGCEAAFIHALSPDATNFQVIGPLWESFVGRADQVPNRVGRAMFGIIYGRPEGERSHPDELQYVAGVAVSSTSDIPEGMVSYRIASGTFAVFTHRGPINKIGETAHEIYRVWLPESGYEHSGIADVERYGARFKPDAEDSEMEYWVSLKPAAARGS